MVFGFRSRAVKTAREAARQRAVDGLGDVEPHAQELDQLAAAAAGLMGAPVALVTLIDRDEMRIVGCFNARWRSLRRAESVCNHAIESPDPLFCVPDLQRDPRLADLPLAQGADAVRFYAGAQLLDPDGHALGMLCVLDSEPRTGTTAEHGRALQRLARATTARLKPGSSV